MMILAADFEGNSDGVIDVEIRKSEAWDHPVVHVSIIVRDSLFSANVDGDIPDAGDIGNNPFSCVVLSLRDRGDGELAMLAAALRWVADNIEEGRTHEA